MRTRWTAPLLLLLVFTLGVMFVGTIEVNFTQIVPMMSFLILATIVMLVFMLRDMELTMREAHVMMLLYGAFGVWMTLEAAEPMPVVLPDWVLGQEVHSWWLNGDPSNIGAR